MATLTVQPSAKDNYLIDYVGYRDSNYGTGTYMDVADDDRHHPVLEFSLAGLPGGATLSAATLQLYYYWTNSDAVGLTTWAYKLTRTDWHETQSTWNIYKTGSNWTVAGGDYVTSSPAGGSVVVPAGYGWMSWSVLAIVQDAYDAANSAEFLLRFATEEGGTQHMARLYSNNYTDNTSLCPKLVIDYTVVIPRHGFVNFQIPGIV